MELQPILHVWINHDNDLVDLTITSQAHPPLKAGQQSEVVHTTQKHPFLTLEKEGCSVSIQKLSIFDDWHYTNFKEIDINDALSCGQFKENFVAASMGVEYSVRFNRNILAMLQDENGAMKWVLPKELGIPLSLEKFSKEEKSDVIVFTYVH